MFFVFWILNYNIFLYNSILNIKTLKIVILFKNITININPYSNYIIILFFFSKFSLFLIICININHSFLIFFSTNFFVITVFLNIPNKNKIIVFIIVIFNNIQFIENIIKVFVSEFFTCFFLFCQFSCYSHFSEKSFLSLLLLTFRLLFLPKLLFFLFF